jgi:NitT/TauT family transport system substrate-binding protein
MRLTTVPHHGRHSWKSWEEIVKHAKSTNVFAALLGISALVIASSLHAAGTLTDINFMMGDVSVNKVPFLIAADRGIYTENGLNVHQFITKGAVDAKAGSGLATVPAQYIKDVNPNPDKVDTPIVLGGGFVGPLFHFVTVATQDNIVRDHILTLPSITSFEDLKGKRIGYSAPGSVTNFDCLAFIKMMGWVPGKDITLVEHSANLDALKSGKVDAIMASNQVVALLPNSGFKDLGDLAKYKIPFAGSGILVKAAWLPQNRATVAHFVKAIVEATALMKKDRKQFDASVGKWYGITNPKVLDRMFADAQAISSKPYPSIVGIKAALAMMGTPAMRAHRAEDFYDSSFVAALDKSGYLDELDR